MKKILIMLSLTMVSFAFAGDKGPEHSLDELLMSMEENDLSVDDMFELAGIACEGGGVGAECEIILDDGISIGIGVCVPVDGVEGGLTCEINVPELNCQSANLADPIFAFGLLLLVGFMLYRRRYNS